MCQAGRISEKNKRVFLNGLKKYQRMGVHVMIDGKEADDASLKRLLESDDDGFYMGDYILEESEKEDCGPGAVPTVYEPPTEYSGGNGRRRFHLKEIRFDKVYHH